MESLKSSRTGRSGETRGDWEAGIARISVIGNTPDESTLPVPVRRLPESEIQLDLPDKGRVAFEKGGQWPRKMAFL